MGGRGWDLLHSTRGLWGGRRLDPSTARLFLDTLGPKTLNANTHNRETPTTQNFKILTH